MSKSHHNRTPAVTGSQTEPTANWERYTTSRTLVSWSPCVLLIMSKSCLFLRRRANRSESQQSPGFLLPVSLSLLSSCLTILFGLFYVSFCSCMYVFHGISCVLMRYTHGRHQVHAPARIMTDSVDAFMHETRVTKRISMRIIQVSQTIRFS